MQTTLRDQSLIVLVRRCREIEERGFECIAPIKKISRYKKHYHYHGNAVAHLARSSFVENEDTSFWRAVYRSVE